MCWNIPTCCIIYEDVEFENEGVFQVSWYSLCRQERNVNSVTAKLLEPKSYDSVRVLSSVQFTVNADSEKADFI